MRPSADGRDTRNARGRATARSIEREAVRLALEHGPAALTVDQICEAVGITQRSFFNHFATKDDALLGWDLPQLSEARVRAYLADPRVGVLSGALGLVELPPELLNDPELVAARFRVLAQAPWLGPRQAARLLPVAERVREVVELKLRSLAGPDVDDAAILASAATITAMAASLTLGMPLGREAGTPGGPGMPGLPGMPGMLAPGMMPPMPGMPPGELPSGRVGSPEAAVPIPDPAAAASGLEGLRWIWDRLI